MPSRLREVVAPLYLFLCLVLGGSAQGIWTNMVLQLLGVAIIAWAAAAPATDRMPLAGRQLLLLLAAGIAGVGLQLIPLPPSIWSHFGGRGPIASGYQLLGIKLPALPLSLTPYKSFATLLSIIPPLALLCAILGLKAHRLSWLAAALLAGTIAGILLGVFQVADPDKGWYLYEQSSFGLATGFFANANHMAILLVISLPFLAAILASARGASMQRYSAIVALTVGAGLVVLVGLALNRSLAGYGLALPVVVASMLIVLPARSALRGWAALLTALLLVGAVGALVTSPVGNRWFASEAATATQSRQEMLSTTAKAMRDFMPFGSGLGSFRDVYQLYEDHDRVTHTYVVHAHNDYAELALELGVAGILLIFGFLLWWGRGVWRAWRYADAGVYARAASIASAAILVHSLVDFPLRTAAISASFAMCLALLVDRRPPPASAETDLWPTRHVVLR